MDTLKAFALGQMAQASGNALRVFDWDKAARIIAERRPSSASAGLSTDLEWTECTIYEDGKPVTEGGGYLASLWAEPVLIIDGEEINCETVRDERGWDSQTVWPESALAILAGAK